jgi:hypothetical protein
MNRRTNYVTKLPSHWKQGKLLAGKFSFSNCDVNFESPRKNLQLPYKKVRAQNLQREIAVILSRPKAGEGPHGQPY